MGGHRAGGADVGIAPFRMRKTSARAPQTVVGRFLYAGATGDRDERERLVKLLNRGRPGWNDDESVVVEAACGLAVRRCFHPDADVRQISAFVSSLRARVGPGATPPGQLETEAVIRSALGEEDVSLDGITAQDLLTIRGVVVMVLARWQMLPAAVIGPLIADAEREAVRRGWSPPLAGEIG